MMKKEKLEQMKELGRGGLSKGLTMLRNAAEKAAAAADAANAQHAANANATSYAAITALEDDGDAASAAATGSAATTTGNGTASGAATTGSRLTYDELVSLSMKLTRQNKMMKAQFQKMQARISTLSVSEADANLLTDFVKNVVGVDLDACHLDEGKAGGDSKNGAGAGGDAADTVAATAKSTIDAKELKERYVILQELNEREHRRVEERLRAELSSLRSSQSSVAVESASNGLDSISLLSFSPVGAPPAPGMHSYDEIDLFNNPFPAPPAAPATAQTTSLADAVVLGSSGFSESVASLEKQLVDARAQLKVLEEQVSTSVQEREELQKKYNDAVQQGADQVATLETQTQELQQAVEELKNAARAHESTEKEWQIRWNEQSDILANIQAELQKKIEVESDLEAENVTIKAKLEKLQHENGVLDQRIAISTSPTDVDGEIATMKDTIASLESVVSEKEEKLTELDKALAIARTENGKLQDTKTNGVSAEREISSSNGDSHGPRDEEIADLTETVATLKRENESLQSKLAELKKLTDADSASQDSLVPLLGELEKVKLERAELDHTLHTLQGEFFLELMCLKRLVSC